MLMIVLTAQKIPPENRIINVFIGCIIAKKQVTVGIRNKIFEPKRYNVSQFKDCCSFDHFLLAVFSVEFYDWQLIQSALFLVHFLVMAVNKIGFQEL